MKSQISADFSPDGNTNDAPMFNHFFLFFYYFLNIKEINFLILGGLSDGASQQLGAKTKKGKGKATAAAAEGDENSAGGSAGPEAEAIKVTLAFKRYIYDPKKKMMQT